MNGLPIPRRYLAIFAISCGNALIVMDGALPTIALPTIARELNAQPSEAVLIVSVYQLVLVMTLLPLSALGSRVGLSRLYRYGQAVFAGSALLCFLAPSLPLLLAARTLQALGAAAALSVSSALLRATYPAAQLGRGLGLNTAVVASSAAAAPLLGGMILDATSWHWIFVATLPLALVSLVAGQRSLPAATGRVEAFDLTAALLCAVTFGLVIGGLLALARTQPPWLSLAVVAAGAAAGWQLVRRELAAALPVLPVDLLTRPLVALSILGAFAAFVGSMTFMLSLPFRLQAHFGFTPGGVGAVMAPWPLAMMLVAPAAGLLSDRFHAGILGGLGMAVATAGMVLLGLLPEGASHGAIAWRMALCGVGYGLFFSPNARVVVAAAPLHRAAAAGALIATNRLLAQSLGAALLAGLLAIGLGSGALPAFIAAALCCAAGVCSVLRLRYP